MAVNSDQPTRVTYPLTSGTRMVTVPFDYLTRTAVEFTILRSQDLGYSKRLVVVDDYRYVSKTQIQLAGDYSSWGDTIEVRRHTPTDRLVDFQDGSVITASNLNIAQLQAIHIAEEARYEISLELDSAVKEAQGYAQDAYDSAQRADNAYQRVRDVIASAGDKDTLARLTAEDGATIIGYGQSTVDTDLRTKGATTSSYGISAKSADDWFTDNSSAFQAMLNKERYVIVDTIVNIGTRCYSNFEGQIISSAKGGHIRPINGDGKMDRNPMITLQHKYCHIYKLIAQNPLKLKSDLTGKDFGRQGAINIRADHCKVEASLFINQLNAVVAESSGGAHGSTVIGNRFIDCIGVATEDRGDAVTLWGSGNTIAYNYANALAGEDCRVGFHMEGPVTPPTNPRPELDKKNCTFVGNLALGKFRRHFAFENVINGISVGNVSGGGATWWGESYIQCYNIYADNVIMYTRTPEDNQGNTWNPRRGACSVINFGGGMTINSKLYLVEGSSGYGFTTGTQTGDIEVSFTGQIYDETAEGMIALDFIRPVRATVDGAVIRGSRLGAQLTVGPISGTERLPVIDFVNVTFTQMKGSAVKCAFGVGGHLSIRNCVLHGSGTYPIEAANLTSYTLSGCMINYDGGWASNSSGISQRIYVVNNINTSGTRMLIRHDGTANKVMGDIEWSFEGNQSIGHSFRAANSILTDVNSKLNQIGKYSGKVVVMESSPRNVLCAVGSAPDDIWVRLYGAGDAIHPV